MRGFVPLLVERAATRTLDATHSRAPAQPEPIPHLNFPPPCTPRRRCGPRSAAGGCGGSSCVTHHVCRERWQEMARPGSGAPVSAAVHHARAGVSLILRQDRGG
ncbi:hypothetical protein [Rhodococcus koreensis]|uniref:hypothetical protein n=1 Tax=Rhodococcus koreensis TaxID=99653 RepID=UPI003B84635C